MMLHIPDAPSLHRLLRFDKVSGSRNVAVHAAEDGLQECWPTRGASFAAVATVALSRSCSEQKK